jgi:small ligand-binding sensory domain FIST
MLASTSRVLDGVRRVPIIGGMASASTAPQNNLLLLDDSIMRTGGVGVTISGDVAVDVMVSQGCRPIATPLVVTSGRRNVIRELGGRRALDVVREVVEGLDEESRRLIANGMFIGRVVNEYKERFGRGDFLIRAVLGVEQESGAIVVGDSVRVGQTVQFHVRDADTAHEDLRLLLAAQQLQTPPLGSLLFTCNGRGTRLFQEPHHDAKTCADTLKGDNGTPMPIAGFFCAGEIGPIGDHSFVHGHTATLAMIRPRRRGAFDND